MRKFLSSVLWALLWCLCWWKTQAEIFTSISKLGFFFFLFLFFCFLHFIDFQSAQHHQKRQKDKREKRKRKTRKLRHDSTQIKTHSHETTTTITIICYKISIAYKKRREINGVLILCLKFSSEKDSMKTEGNHNSIHSSFREVGFTLKVNPPLCGKSEISLGK